MMNRINRKYIHLLLSGLMIISACSEKTEKHFSVSSLDTVEKRKHFLDSILEIDQRVRNESTAIQQKFGYDSEEHKAAGQRMRDVDFSNLEVIGEYLRTFDYPSKEEYGQDAYTAPWMVIHHAPSGFGRDYREENIQYLIAAWEKGVLSDKNFSFFLNRAHQIRFNEWFSFEGSMKTSDEIDTLLFRMNYK